MSSDIWSWAAAWCYCFYWELPLSLWPPWWSNCVNGCSGFVSVTYFKHLLVLLFSVWGSLDCSCLLSYSFLAIKTPSHFLIFLLSRLALVPLFLNRWKIAQVWTGVCGVLTICSQVLSHVLSSVALENCVFKLSKCFPVPETLSSF